MLSLTASDDESKSAESQRWAVLSDTLSDTPSDPFSDGGGEEKSPGGEKIIYCL